MRIGIVAMAQNSSGADALVAGKRILIVEDEYFLADDIRQALSGCGAEGGGPVATVDAAMEVVRDQRIDAAILDINLRGQTSFAVADALLALDTPVVFASGYDETTIPARYRHVAHWVKPFDAEELVRALPSLMEGDRSGVEEPGTVG